MEKVQAEQNLKAQQATVQALKDQVSGCGRPILIRRGAHESGGRGAEHSRFHASATR